jgi:hypothetical protein
MTFIPKPDPKSVIRETSFRPIRPAFRDRQYGSEFNKWELALLKEFSCAKASKNPTISGSVVYDRALGTGRFLLIPATHLSQDYVICECASDIPIPANLSQVTVTGKKKFFYGYWEIMVDSISFQKTTLPIKPEINFREFQDQLFLQWGGIDSPLRELLAFEFVSSPPLSDFGQVGGLNVTLYDGTLRGETRRLLKYFRNMIPLDIALGKSGNLAIPELALEQPLSPFSWQFKSFDADKPLSQHLAVFLDSRRSKRFSEISVGLGSKRNQPKSLYEPPLTKVDQPTLLPENAEMLKMSFDPPLEVTKYIITMQTIFPTIGKTKADLDETLELASKKIVDMAEKYDLPQAVKRHGLFDPNYYGKPQSILRLALAFARSQAKQTMNDEMIMKVFDEFYLKNVEAIMDAWEDIMTSKGVELVSLEDFERQVLKFVTEKESKDYGVGFSPLNERFPDSIKLRLALDHLDNIGKIYMVRHDVYRSIPFVE